MSRGGLIGPMASWITIAGWASAAAAEYGTAWMVTPEGILSPEEAVARATQPTRTGDAVASWRRRIPESAVQLIKDARRVGDNRRFRARFDPAPWATTRIRFVLSLHGLGFDGGLHLARRLAAPSVLVVDACQVEEARSWGVRRPGWGWAAERWGERPQLRAADIVVCVSDEVADSVARVSDRRDGVVVIPNGVDVERFSPAPPDDALLDALGLRNRFAVGWSGSFRTFHGLGTLIEAAAVARKELPELVLVLVGDGLGRPAIEQQARDLGVPLVLPGTVPYDQMPEYLRVMDVATVLAPARESFHYSPVKLREYQACGVPVIASAAGELGRDLDAGDDALIVPPGDAPALANAILATARDRAGAVGRARRARNDVVASGSWAARVRALETALGDPPR